MVKQWSNSGPAPARRGRGAGRTRDTRSNARSHPGYTLLELPVKSWSRTGQTLVKRWNDTGQTLVKNWSNTGRARGAGAARHRPFDARRQRAGVGPAEALRGGSGSGGGGRAKAGPVRLTSRILVKHGQRGAWRRPAGCGPSAGMQSGQTIGQTFELVKPWIWSHHGSGQTIHLVKPGRVPADR